MSDPVNAESSSGASASEPAQAAVPDSAQPQSGSLISGISHQFDKARADFETANEKIRQRTGRDLIVAVLIGLLIGGAFLVALLLWHPLFVVLVILLAFGAIWELVLALQQSGRKVDLIPQLVAGTLFVSASYFVDYLLLWVLLFLAIFFVSLWRLIAQMVSRDGRSYGEVIGDVVVGAFVQMYLPLLAVICIVMIRQEQGNLWIISFLGVAIAADTGAYFAGISFGKHPMAPKVSPKKTWEGFAGAVIASVIAGVLFTHLMIGLPIWAGVIFSLVILLTATFGDLGESMLKRDLGIKDMSSWVPGHGGILDRLDSLLPSAPAALALYLLMTPMLG